MQYSQKIKLLEQAVYFAENFGDVYWFHQYYHNARLGSGIVESIEIALKNQGLWIDFLNFINQCESV